MIARIWRGVVRTEDAAEYIEYVRETGIEHYRSTPGNSGAWTLRDAGLSGGQGIVGEQGVRVTPSRS